MKTIMQFDFRSCWPQVQEVIDLPDVREVLEMRLADFDEQYPGGKEYRDKSQPWTYCTQGYWGEYASREADLGGHLDNLWQDLGYPSQEALDEALESDDEAVEDRWFARIQEIEDQFLPRPGTPEYYMAHGACHWLSDWQALIGQILVPDMDWRPIRGRYHSTAGGFLPGSKSRTPLMIFDLLRENQDPAETVREARRRSEPKPVWAFAPAEPVTWTKIAVIGVAA
jgi:hypothetical protein